MIVIASANGSVGMEAAMAALRAGGSALDAVEAGTKVVELNTEDHSVGVGGYPNLLGEVELDASIMEGTTRRAGAVAALRDYPHPISVARAVLEHLPQHLLLAGEGAGRFAQERGFAKMPLLTPEAEEAWRQKMAGVVHRDAANLSFQVTLAQDPERTVGTVNFIAQDAQGRIASAVSTSGWAFKYPGRVGDSPLSVRAIIAMTVTGRAPVQAWASGRSAPARPASWSTACSTACRWPTPANRRSATSPTFPCRRTSSR